MSYAKPTSITRDQLLAATRNSVSIALDDRAVAPSAALSPVSTFDDPFGPLVLGLFPVEPTIDPWI